MAATPNQNDYLVTIQKQGEQILKIWRAYLISTQQKLDHLKHRLMQLHPQTKILNQFQNLDELYDKLCKLIKNNINQHRHELPASRLSNLFCKNPQ